MSDHLDTIRDVWLGLCFLAYADFMVACRGVDLSENCRGEREE